MSSEPIPLSVEAGALLERLRDEPPCLAESELDRIEQANRADAPPESTWLDR